MALQLNDAWNMRQIEPIPVGLAALACKCTQADARLTYRAANIVALVYALSTFLIQHMRSQVLFNRSCGGSRRDAVAPSTDIGWGRTVPRIFFWKYNTEIPTCVLVHLAAGRILPFYFLFYHSTTSDAIRDYPSRGLPGDYPSGDYLGFSYRFCTIPTSVCEGKRGF